MILRLERTLSLSLSLSPLRPSRYDPLVRWLVSAQLRDTRCVKRLDRRALFTLRVNSRVFLCPRIFPGRPPPPPLASLHPSSRRSSSPSSPLSTDAHRDAYRMAALHARTHTHTNREWSTSVEGSEVEYSSSRARGG